MEESLKKRTAVILFNLGGPDSVAAIRPFLFNFFTDKNIIRLPAIGRWPLALLIALRRSKREAGVSYGSIGGQSPLLGNTQEQADALQAALGEDARVFVCMRYWHPMAGEVARAVKAYGPDRIVLLPLYPQYSTTTTRSSVQQWTRAAKAAGLAAPTSLLCCYPTDPAFIAASAARIAAVMAEAQEDVRAKGLKPPRLLFSAHGLPEVIIADGDPYQWQCEQSAKAVAVALGDTVSDWTLCYQSRVGRLQWLGPSTDSELERAAHDQVPVVIYPLAFTQEHVETLAEIEIEYRHKAKELGVPGFWRVPTVGTEANFIAGLAKLVQEIRKDNGNIKSNEGPAICPTDCKRCAQKDLLI